MAAAETFVTVGRTIFSIATSSERHTFVVIMIRRSGSVLWGRREMNVQCLLTLSVFANFHPAHKGTQHRSLPFHIT